MAIGQVTVVDPEAWRRSSILVRRSLVFPKGHGHAIKQTLGPAPCHAILAFDDGSIRSIGTFGISDWMSRYDTSVLSQAFGVSAELSLRSRRPRPTSCRVKCWPWTVRRRVPPRAGFTRGRIAMP